MNSQQNLIQNQQIIVDQEYSNDILCCVLSSLQSLTMAYQYGNQYNFGSKVFSHYDVVDYSHKSIPELKSQLNIHLFLFRASRTAFQMEHPGVQWTLPSNFDPNMIMVFIQNCCKAMAHDQDAVKLAYTTLELLGGNKENLFIDNYEINLHYTQQQKQLQRKNLLNAGNTASEQMDKRKEELDAKNIKHQSELTACVDTNNLIFQMQQPQGQQGQYQGQHGQYQQQGQGQQGQHGQYQGQQGQNWQQAQSPQQNQNQFGSYQNYQTGNPQILNGSIASNWNGNPNCQYVQQNQLPQNNNVCQQDSNLLDLQDHTNQPTNQGCQQQYHNGNGQFVNT